MRHQVWQTVPMMKKYVLLTVIWLGVFMLPELIARVFLADWSPEEEQVGSMIPDPEVGWLYRPGSVGPTARRSGTFIANQYGLREKELGEKTEPRILFLGDSFTWGWGVANEARYTDKLQQALPGYEMINAGINGYSTIQSFLMLRKLYQDLRPDLVVYQMFHNDFIENLEAKAAYELPHLDHHNNFQLTNYPVTKSEPSLYIRLIIFVGDNTYFYRQLILHAAILLQKLGFNLSGEEYVMPSSDQHNQGMRVALDMLMKYCQQQEIPLIIIHTRLNQQQILVVQEISGNYIDRDYDVIVRNLDQAVLLDQDDYTLGDHSGHWNEKGHALVADYLQEVIMDGLTN